MTKAIFALLALCCLAPAQVVRITNTSDTAWSGWHRVTVDRRPPHLSGARGTDLYMVGRQVGESLWVVDVRTSLEPYATKVLPIGEWAAASIPTSALPANLWAHFGGLPTVNGTAMSLVSVLRQDWVASDTTPEHTQDGAGITTHWRARTGRMLVVDLWLTWISGQPDRCHGEALVTCSNPSVNDLTETAGVELTFGHAIVLPLGGGMGTLVPPGTRWADGQARLVPLTFVWLSHVTDMGSVTADANYAIVGVGIDELLPDGNPVLPAGFDAATWSRQRLPESIRRLWTWEVGVVGVNRLSGDTGAQEDQVFVRGEAMRWPGAALIAYLGAAKLANRPCHHREPDGSLLDPSRHVSPRLVLWDMRAHWAASVSPDRLGKSSNLSVDDAGGWWGADVEHWLINTLAAGARLTGSPALGCLLETHARAYPLQWTTTAGWSTTQPYASRAVGWEGIAAVHLWRGLSDRALAVAVRKHWRDRWARVISGAYAGRDIVDIRRDDPRLGAGEWWIPWQQSVAAYGLDLAGAEFGVPEARAVGLRLARKVLSDAWQHDGTRWLSRAQMPVSPPFPAPSGDFNYFGLALAPAVVLRHEPENERARSIWTQLRSGAAATRDTSWLAPGVK